MVLLRCPPSSPLHMKLPQSPMQATLYWDHLTRHTVVSMLVETVLDPTFTLSMSMRKQISTQGKFTPMIMLSGHESISGLLTLET